MTITQMDLEKILEETLLEFERIGYTPVNFVHPSIRVRPLTRAYGVATLYADGTFRISISRYLLRQGLDAVKSTIVHEVIHTLPGGWGNHGKPFQSIMRDYIEAYGPLADKRPLLEDHEYKYIVGCPGCEARWYRVKKSTLVKNPGRYQCRECKLPLERIK